MQQFSYNLIDEAWIPAKTTDGKEVKLGLLALLARAGEISDLIAPAAVVYAGLYRLLLAICGRVFGPTDGRAWKRLWQDGRFDTQALTAYFNDLRARFNLFDDQRPFYQAEDKRVQPKMLLRLVPHLASGNNATLFDHSTEGTGVTLEPGEAALYLVALQAYGLGGLSGLPEKFTGAPPVRGVSFFVQGKNLFENLTLNLIPSNEKTLHAIPANPEGKDLPCWEMDDPFAPRSQPNGLFDYLTWQNRRVKLIPTMEDGQVVVRKMTEAPGLRLDGTFIDGITTRDPYQYYRLGKAEPMVLRFREERAVWRDSYCLLQFGESEDHLPPPANLLWLRQLARRGLLDGKPVYHLRAVGLAADKAKALFYGDETLPLPAAYLENDELVFALRSALEKAENLKKALYAAVSRLAETMIAFDCDLQDRKPDPTLVDHLREHLNPERVFWGGLEPGFYALVNGLTSDPEASMLAWFDLLRRQTWAAWEHTLTLAGDDIRALKAGASARAIVRSGLKAQVPQKEGNHG